MHLIGQIVRVALPRALRAPSTPQIATLAFNFLATKAVFLTAAHEVISDGF